MLLVIPEVSKLSTRNAKLVIYFHMLKGEQITADYLTVRVA
jgi:hypothetical protein